MNVLYGTQIVGTGCGFPEREMTNAEFEKFLDTSDQWIRSRTGIEKRRIADPSKSESTLSFATLAARRALESAGISADQIGLVIVGTVTPDTVMPCTANQLQAAIGAKNAFTFDLQAACSGFLYGLSIADHFIRLGSVEYALVIGAETLSTLVDWSDRSTCVLFGDAGGAVVVKRTQDPHRRLLSTRLYSDGRYADLLNIPHGYGKVPPYSAQYRRQDHKIKMKGKEVFKVAVRAMIDASSTVLKENNVDIKDVDLFIFHQANLRIIEMCAHSLDIPMEKVWVNVQKYGNTSAATLPICLDEASRSGVIGPGKLILMATFGGGLTWGSALLRL